ncbi:MAG TPA: transglutaminase domain-containing protein [Candidatus Limnocylindrales bacterium]|nr:transglutaminase domain-containing protein [Candidatus Limnocylindrales bacterium]
MTSEPRRLRLPAAPEEGWLTLVLLGVMGLMMAQAIDDTAWVLGDGELTNFLWVATLGGLLAGFVGSKVGWSRWVANALGAAFAALIVPILVGQTIEPDKGLAFQYVAVHDAVFGAWRDLIILGLPRTIQTGHHLLVLGLICWGTGQFAASAVFRHHRPLSAVVVMGAVLVANMAATLHEQIMFLVVFSIAALGLLTKLHALDEQATWARRRIGDPSAVGSIYLRGGIAFIGLAVVAAFALTQAASSSPLAGAWEDLKPWLLDVSSSIQRFLPTLEDSRGIGGVRFGPRATVIGSWTTDGGLAVTVQRTPGDNTHYYWRAVAYDRYDDTGWQWSDDAGANRIPRLAGEELLRGTADDVLTPGTKDVTFQITPYDLHGTFAISPLAPLMLDRDSTLEATADDDYFQAVEITGHDSYSVTARVPLIGDKDGGLTENKLRAAGDAYPPALKARYTQLTPKAVGPEAQQVLDDVLLKLKDDDIAETPYDIAAGLVTELQDNERFTYDPTVLDIHAQCGELSVSECFATYRRGYCEHYATLMTVLLREKGIPARFVEGFLPGDLDERTGIEQVPNSAAHAWVEVFFPGTGWVSFDPTGGGVSASSPLPSGRPVASAPPSRFPSLNPFPFDDDLGSRDPSAVPPTRGGNGGIGPGGVLLIVAVLLIAVGLTAFLVWRRGPRGPLTPEGAWLGIGKLASRFGFGPRPTQTAYEYATALGEVMPAIRPELETVATASVEVRYGGRVMADDRLQAIRDAYSKLRVKLLRLLFRRRDRRRR